MFLNLSLSISPPHITTNNVSSSRTELAPPVEPTANCLLSDSIRASLIMKDINFLKTEDISLLHCQKSCSSVLSTCHICITFLDENSLTTALDSEWVNNLLGCSTMSDQSTHSQGENPKGVLALSPIVIQ